MFLFSGHKPPPPLSYWSNSFSNIPPSKSLHRDLTLSVSPSPLVFVLGVTGLGKPPVSLSMSNWPYESPQSLFYEQPALGMPQSSRLWATSLWKSPNLSLPWSNGFGSSSIDNISSFPVQLTSVSIIQQWRDRSVIRSGGWYFWFSTDYLGPISITGDEGCSLGFPGKA